MAETTVKQHFIKYSGTKAQFIAAGYPATYEDKIVFIKGGTNGTGECIYTRGMYFANFNDLITAYVAGMNFLKGVTVDGTSYNAAAGGGYVAFEATDPATVGISVSNGKITIGLTTAFLNNITNLGAEITNIKNNYATISAMNTAIGNAKDELKGTSSDTHSSATIEGAKKYADRTADAKKSEVIGTSGDASSADTVYGAKNFAQEKVNGVATTLIGTASDATDKSTIYGAKNFATNAANTAESNAKGYANTKKSEVIGNALTDTKDSKTIEGVIKLINDKTSGIASEGVVSDLSSRVEAIEDDYLVEQDKTEITGLINTEKGRIDTLVGDDKDMSAREIVQDEVAKQLTSENITESFDTLKEIAEWLSSHPEDVTAMNEAIEANADAIEVLNGTDKVNGSVAKTVKDAVNTVRGWVSEGYATKDQVNAKYTKPSTGIPKTDLADAVQTTLGLADSAYQKPSTGIPAADLATDSVETAKIKDGNVTKAKLAEDTKTSLGYADTALQSIGAGDYITVADKTGNNGAKTQTVTAKVATIESATALKQGFADAFDTKRQIEGAASAAESNAKSYAKSYADSQWEWLDLD
jgi:hypothetical protein